jgi:hypothetical protein
LYYFASVSPVLICRYDEGEIRLALSEMMCLAEAGSDIGSQTSAGAE